MAVNSSFQDNMYDRFMDKTQADPEEAQKTQSAYGQ